MYGVESTTSAAGTVRAGFGQHGSAPASDSVAPGSRGSWKRGALDLAREAVKQALGTIGFVDPTGPQQANFKTFLHRGPIEMDMEDLKPGLWCDVASWVASELAENPRQAEEAQAHIRPEAAVKLLT